MTEEDRDVVNTGFNAKLAELVVARSKRDNNVDVKNARWVGMIVSLPRMKVVRKRKMKRVVEKRVMRAVERMVTKVVGLMLGAMLTQMGERVSSLALLVAA